MEERNAIVTRPDTGMGAVLSASNIRAQVNLIQEVKREVMTEGQHYGTIPGCGDKPTLLKPGAEKLSLVFRLRPIMSDAKDIQIVEMGSGHREVRALCHILNEVGLEVATGVGSCSTMEKKYRYRDAQRKCPNCGAAAIIKGKEEYGGGFLCFAKKGGCGAKFPDDDKAITGQALGQVENPDIADTYNTVLKIAKKRAYVDGVLSATGGSDFFTQDIEDMPAEMFAGRAVREAETEPAAGKPAGKPEGQAKPPTPRRASASAKKAPEAASAPVEGFIEGVVGKKYTPRGEWNTWTMEGHEKEYLQSKDPQIIETMNSHGKLGDKIIVRFMETKNGQYTNRDITAIEPVGQEPEEAQVGD
jgi:hypothetical protein